MRFKEYLFKISFLYNFCSVHFLMKLARIKTISPFYHFVVENKNDLVNQLYTPKTKKHFIRDLQFFKKYFYSLSIEDFVNGDLKNNKFGFFLSFDDGLSNFNSVVTPILLKEKIHAINFLNSDFIDNKGLFYRYKVNILIEFILKNKLLEDQKNEIAKFFDTKIITKKRLIRKLKKATFKDTNILDNLAMVFKISFSDYLEKIKPYLTTNQISELQKQGFDFGAHSKNHPCFAEISLDEQLKQTVESVNILQKRFSLESRFFSFPFSDDGVSNEFFSIVKQEGIITFGTSGIRDENSSMNFQRIPMEYNSVYSAETIIKGELIYYVLKRKILGKK